MVTKKEIYRNIFNIDLDKVHKCNCPNCSDYELHQVVNQEYELKNTASMLKNYRKVKIFLQTIQPVLKKMSKCGAVFSISAKIKQSIHICDKAIYFLQRSEEKNDNPKNDR